MITNKISEQEASALKIANLPTRPTAPQEFGGKGYTPSQLKEAFDALPLLIISRLNSIIDDIGAEQARSVRWDIKTGIREGHTLGEFFAELCDGNAATYIRVLDKSLAEYLIELSENISQIRTALESEGII